MTSSQESSKIDNASILGFLNTHQVAVLSTVNKDNLADAAPIYFVIKDNFDLFFLTPTKTRKHMNLKLNNDVVLTIVDEGTKETVQIRGKASEQEGQFGSVLNQLAQKISNDVAVTATLPILKHGNQEKIAIQVKPYEVRMRRYTDTTLEEGTVALEQ